MLPLLRWHSNLQLLDCMRTLWTAHRGVWQDSDGRPWPKRLYSVTCMRVGVWNIAGRSIPYRHIVELDCSAFPYHNGIYYLTQIKDCRLW